MQLSNKALGIFTSVMIIVVLMIAFFVLKPEFDPQSAEIVKDEQKQENKSKDTVNKDSEQKESDEKSSEETQVEKEPVDKTSDEKETDKNKSEDKSSEDKSTSTKKQNVEDEIAKRVAAEIENEKKTKKRLDEQLEFVSNKYVEKLTKVFEKTEEEYLKLKETSKGDSKVLNKFFEEKSLEIGEIYKEANVKIIDFEYKDAAANYKDFDKWKEPFIKIYDDGMKSLQDLHTKTSKELVDEAKKKAKEEDAKEKESTSDSN